MLLVAVDLCISAGRPATSMEHTCFSALPSASSYRASTLGLALRCPEPIRPPAAELPFDDARCHPLGRAFHGKCEGLSARIAPLRSGRPATAGFPDDALACPLADAHGVVGCENRRRRCREKEMGGWSFVVKRAGQQGSRELTVVARVENRGPQWAGRHSSSAGVRYRRWSGVEAKRSVSTIPCESSSRRLSEGHRLGCGLAKHVFVYRDRVVVKEDR